MGRRNKVLRLPVDIRTQVDRMIFSRQMDDGQIVLWLQEQGFDITRSGFSRYAKGLRDAMGDAANYPGLSQEEGGATWLILTEIRRLRASIDELKGAIKS